MRKSLKNCDNFFALHVSSIFLLFHFFFLNLIAMSTLVSLKKKKQSRPLLKNWKLKLFATGSDVAASAQATRLKSVPHYQMTINQSQHHWTFLPRWKTRVTINAGSAPALEVSCETLGIWSLPQTSSGDSAGNMCPLTVSNVSPQGSRRLDVVCPDASSGWLLRFVCRPSSATVSDHRRLT